MDTDWVKILVIPVTMTVGILAIVKPAFPKKTVKFVPLVGIPIGIVSCWLCASGNLIPFHKWQEWVLYGIIAALMATGVWSSAKNVTQGIKAAPRPRITMEKQEEPVTRKIKTNVGKS